MGLTLKHVNTWGKVIFGQTSKSQHIKQSHCTITVFTHWWSTVAHLVHQGRRTQNCWSWQSRGECSRHYLPHRDWSLNERRGETSQPAANSQTRECVLLKSGSFQQVRMMRSEFSSHQVTALWDWKMKVPAISERPVMLFATNWNAIQTIYRGYVK